MSKFNFDFDKYRKEVNIYLKTKGISGDDDAPKILKKFHKDFTTTLLFCSLEHNKPYEETLEVLSNPENLTDSKILLTNFRENLTEIIKPVLSENKVVMELSDLTLESSGKGVGAGELTFVLFLSDYRYASKGDGTWGSGYKSEVKNGKGASLKTSSVASLRHIDALNDKFFNGHPFGYTNPKLVENHLREVDGKPEIYRQFLKEVYFDVDTTELTDKVIPNYRNIEELKFIIGQFAMVRYKDIDEHDNLLMVDPEEKIVVNIFDPNDIRGLGLNFTPRMLRKTDTTAVADGYVNVSIGNVSSNTLVNFL